MATIYSVGSLENCKKIIPCNIKSFTSKKSIILVMAIFLKNMKKVIM